MREEKREIKKYVPEAEVILEEKDFVVLNKPAGMIVHAPHRFTADSPTIVDFVRTRYPETKKVGDDPETRPGIVHRLDKDTSGVLVIARTNDFFFHLKNLFQRGLVKKMYRALVWGRVPLEGVIDISIGLKPGSVKRSARARTMKMVKHAVTEYKTMSRFIRDGEEFSLVRVFPKTGRTHQIRVHFLEIHHPIIGDQMYGKRKNPWGLERQFLHAESIEFPLPDGKRFRIEAEMPKDLLAIVADLEKTGSGVLS